MHNIQERLTDLSPAKRALLEQLLIQKASKQSQSTTIAKQPADVRPILSRAEQRLWFVDQLERDDPFYNMPLAARLTGKLDSMAFQVAVQKVAQRHDSLRTTYTLVDGKPERIVHDSVTIPVSWVDVSHQRDPEKAAKQHFQSAARETFDLTAGPLLRVVVYKTAPAEHIVLLVMHHIVSDGWSMIVMMRELTEFYATTVSGRESTLAPLAIQYSDFAHWQEKQLSAANIESQLEYWRKQLDDAPEVLDLPTDYPRPAVQNFDGKTVPLRFSKELTSKINAIALQNDTTPFVVLLAAQALVLGRYSRQDDVVLGTASAGRNHPEIEDLIGFFVNTLAVRVRLEEISFHELIKQVAATVLDAHQHADLPFEKLVDEFAAGRDRSYSPIFQSALVLQNLNRDQQPAAGLTVQPMLVDNGTAKYDLTFFLWEEDQQLIGHVEFRTALFSEATVARLGECFEAFLDAATDQPEVSIRRLPIVSAAQRVQVIESFNKTTKEIEHAETLHELFQSQARKYPDNIAAVHGGQQLTYAELDSLSSRIANGLADAGVERESAVVVLMQRSIDLLAATLGISKSGGSFVLLDPSTPQARVDYIVGATNAKMVITADTIEGLKSCTKSVSLPSVSRRDRAYVVFTSGSTGNPKGVEVEHRSITNFINAQAERMHVTESDRTTFTFSPAFDGAISEIFYPFSRGATCVIVDSDVVLDPQRLTKYLNDQRVTAMKLPPSLLAMLQASDFDHVKTLVSAGDKLTGELARRWITDDRQFLNGYGPTEVAVGCTMRTLTVDDMARPPIGIPMNNMRVYVLDRHRQVVPIGGKGEIYVGGIGVARGYLNQPELTAKSFVPDPFADDYPNSRMYRTGDLGRWLPDGNLEFIGRADSQICLRGFRVEPGEIAAALEQLSDVRQAEVVHRTDSESNQLVAYVVPEADSDLVSNAQALESDHVNGWKELFEQAHRASPVVLDPSFNTTGWVSTYTGKPISNPEMMEWTQGAVNRILSLKPKSVLEIGCGTGLLLLRIVDHVDRYVATDLLQGSLDNVTAALRTRPDVAGKVSLHQQLADQYDKLGDAKFDTIVLNSVAQYFPSVDYLVRVIKGAVERLNPGGTIFLGDLRNNQLHRALATSVELFNSDNNLPIDELRSQIESRIEHEEELLLDPQLLQSLVQQCPRITQADVLLKNASATNELSRFRYDVILRADTIEPTLHYKEMQSGFDTTPIQLASLLAGSDQQGIRVHGIPNPRVKPDCDVVQQVRSSTAPSIAALKASTTNDNLIDPNDYFALADQFPVRVIAQWNPDDPSLYDITIRPNNITQETSIVDSPAPVAAFVPEQANDPLSSRRSQYLTKNLRKQLRDVLPSYMIPTALVVLKEFPRTVNGKVDRRALPAPVGRPAWAGDFIEPATETEKKLAEIWEDLLDVRPIGINDDFFELGGHSMLAVRMTSAIENEFGVQLPLQALFQDPTVGHLANVLEHPEQFAAASTIVPLQQSQTGTPLFCVHPAGGTVFCYLELVKHLSNQRPIYGLQAQGIDGNALPHDSLVEMARHYAAAIKEKYPHGPVHIAGWSLGGNIAFEVARQLEISGVKVEIVALLDSGLLSSETILNEEDFLPLLMALFPGAMNVSLEELRGKEREDQLQFFIDRATVAGIVPEEEFDKAGNIFGVFQSNVKAVHQYEAMKYDGKIHLFRPADQSKTNNLFDDPVLGWRAVAEEVKVIEVPGDHAHMLQDPAVNVLAANLEQVMQSYSSL